MPVRLRLPDLSPFDGDSGDIELDPADMRPMWLACLAMAVRDDANAVHWQPCEFGHLLSYTVGATRYGLVEPGAECGPSLFDAARRLISPGVRGWAARHLWRAGTAVLECESPSGRSRWHGAWWSAGEMTGVDFVLLDRFVPENRIAEARGAGLAGDAGREDS